MKRLVLTAVTLALVFPAQALAHATLEQASPGFRQRLASSPRLVTLSFDQYVKVLPGSVQLFSAKHAVPVQRIWTDRFVLKASLPRLPKGAYTVRWHALSSDGHVVSGVFTFGVRANAPPPTEAFGASGPTTSEHVVRWLYFLALALVVGGLGFRLLVLRRGPLTPPAEKRFYVTVGIGVVAAIDVGIAAFLLRAEDALQLPFGRLLYGDLAPLARSRFGDAFIAMTLGFALVAALVFLAWLTDRTVLLWPAFVLALAFASGLSLSGHSAADAGASWKSQVADWAHLSAACLWIGGLIQLALVVWPLMPDLRRDAFLAFSRLATVCVGVLLLAGIYLAILRLPQLSDLWTTGYGEILLVKIGLVSVAFAWGGLHKLVVVPAVARGSERALPRLRGSLLGESMVGMAVLLAAAVLVDAKPPVQPAPTPPAASSVQR
ncbi:MAG: copper resistance protein CopC [Actinomycetota bacterium]|nr:copper resistance protein CopC [Actinomycetota bacterium]